MEFWNSKKRSIHGSVSAFESAVRIANTYPESTYRLEVDTNKSTKFLMKIWGVQRVTKSTRIPNMYWVDKKWFEEIESLRKRVAKALAK